jgi:hypothetical protein
MRVLKQSRQTEYDRLAASLVWTRTLVTIVRCLTLDRRGGFATELAY